MRPVVDSYSIEEAAAVLGVRRRRIFELVARGVLAGTPEDSGGMRIFLKGMPAAPATPVPSADESHRETNGNGGSHATPNFEATPFRELLTEFRNLTERYGQALLALGEARGEVAALRTRVELLEARVDLRLPPGNMPFSWARPSAAAGIAAPELPSSEASAAEAAPDAADVAAMEAAQPDSEPDVPVSAMPEAPTLTEADRPRRSAARRRRRRAAQAAVEGIPEALARADDPTPSTLPGAEEAAAAFAELQREVTEQESRLDEREPIRTETTEEPETAAEPVAEGPDALAVADAVAASEALPDAFLADDALGDAPEEATANASVASQSADEPSGEADDMHEPPQTEEPAQTFDAEATAPEPIPVAAYSSEWDEPDWIAEEDIEELSVEPMATQDLVPADAAPNRADVNADQSGVSELEAESPAAAMDAEARSDADEALEPEERVASSTDSQPLTSPDEANVASPAWLGPDVESPVEALAKPEAEPDAVAAFASDREAVSPETSEPAPEVIFEPEPAFESGMVSSLDIDAGPDPGSEREAVVDTQPAFGPGRVFGRRFAPDIAPATGTAPSSEPDDELEPIVAEADVEPAAGESAAAATATDEAAPIEESGGVIEPQPDSLEAPLAGHAADSSAGEIAQASVERGVEEEVMWLGEGFADGPSAPTAPPGSSGGGTASASPRPVSPAGDQALTRLAEERGWDDQELVAIRSLLAQPNATAVSKGEAEVTPIESETAPQADLEPAAVAGAATAQPEPEPVPAPESQPPAPPEVDEAFDWEQGPAAWSPSPAPSPDASGELPGALELDEALARFGSRTGTADPALAEATSNDSSPATVESTGSGKGILPAASPTDAPFSEPPAADQGQAKRQAWSKAGPPATTSKPVATTGTTPPPLTSPTFPTPIVPGTREPRNEDSAQTDLAPSPAERPADPEWLHGRRGPAASAYRRLRRLFPR